MIINERKHTELTKKDFYYDLPPELIAQTPSEKRDMSRLLVVDRKSESYTDRIFHDITDYLKPNDTLVINDSKVIPARLFGIKTESGINCETMLLRLPCAYVWEMSCKTRKTPESPVRDIIR